MSQGCICICVYSVTLFIVNLCLNVGLLLFYGVFAFYFYCFTFFFHFSFFIFFKPYYICSTCFLLFAFPTLLFPLRLIFNVYKSSSSTSFTFAYLFFLSFLSAQHVGFIFIALFPNGTLLQFHFLVCVSVSFLLVYIIFS